jgi:hypothetical protein
METLLLYLIGAVGCTLVLTASSICAPIRKASCRLLLRFITIGCPLYCAMCSGVWVGLAVGAAYVHRISVQGCFDVLVTIAVFGFSTSACAHTLSWWLRSKGLFTDPEHDGWRYGKDGKYEEVD